LQEFIQGVYRKFFLKIDLTEEDTKKHLQYRQNFQREQAKKTSASFEEFLLGLQTRLTIWEAREQDVRRVAQLTQKTNQFNLTTKRYLESEIHEFVRAREYRVFVGSVTDRFGDSGIVGVMILKAEPGGTDVFLDSFLMSCRVMGRFIEDSFLGFVEKRMAGEGFGVFHAQYLPTNKNKPVRSLLERLGFALVSEDPEGRKKYLLELGKKPERKSFCEVVEG